MAFREYEPVGTPVIFPEDVFIELDVVGVGHPVSAFALSQNAFRVPGLPGMREIPHFIGSGPDTERRGAPGQFGDEQQKEEENGDSNCGENVSNAAAGAHGSSDRKAWVNRHTSQPRPPPFAKAARAVRYIATMIAIARKLRRMNAA